MRAPTKRASSPPALTLWLQDLPLPAKEQKLLQLLDGHSQVIKPGGPEADTMAQMLLYAL